MPFKFHVKIILRGRRLARLGKLMKLQDPGCLQSPKIVSPFPKLRRAVTSAGGGAPSLMMLTARLARISRMQLL